MKRSFYRFPSGVIDINAVVEKAREAINMEVYVQDYPWAAEDELVKVLSLDYDSTTGIHYVEKGEEAAFVIPVYAGIADIAFALRLVDAARDLYSGIKILKGSKEADTSPKSEQTIWKSSQKAMADAIAEKDIYQVIEGSYGSYRIFTPFLQQLHPECTDAELVSCAFHDFELLMNACRTMDSFGTATITDPDGEEYNAIMLTNRTAGQSLTDKVVLCRPGSPKIVDTEDFRNAIIRHPSFTVYDILSFSMHEMSEDEWNKFCDSIPGTDVPKPKTYLMRWNPAISSFNAENYNDASEKFDGDWCMDWSIFEHQEARKYDRYYMLREGDGENPGIYFHGAFTSDPYEGKDWRGSDRKRFYVDITCLDGRPLDNGPWITPEELEKIIPEINWRSGHSGELLTDEQAEKLDALWAENYKPYWREGEDETDEDEKEFDNAPGHAGHLSCVDKDVDGIFDNLPEMIKKFEIVGEAQNHLFFTTKGDKLSLRTINGFRDDIEGSVIEELFPYVVNNEPTASFELVKIKEYANGLEAVLTVRYADRDINFYDMEYALHKKQYKIGSIYDFSLSAIAYGAEIVPVEERSIHLEPEQVIQMGGFESTNPDGSVDLNAERTIGFLQTDKERPDDTAFQSPLESRVSKATLLGYDFFRFDICIYTPDFDEAFGEDGIVLDPFRPLNIPIAVRTSFFTDKPSKNTPVRGLIWLHGRLIQTK